jgi:hypothetical protein
MKCSEIIEVVLVLVEIHLYFFLLLGDLFGSHISNKFVDILIFDFFLFCAHDVLHILIHDIHPFLLSHEPLHRILVVHSFHFIVGAAHDLCHSRHHILHGLANTHLLQSK